MTSRRRNARGESTLRIMLQETANLVSQYGYDGTTISRITRATGKSASSIYWSFSTKDELIAAALEATYKRRPEEIGSWSGYRADIDLTYQVTQILDGEFTSKSTEAPVRLGLMIALEGDATDTAAQVPLRSRRKRVRENIYAWWQEAAKHHNHADPQFNARVMSQLTLAFLDGHYISDQAVPISSIHGPSAFVAKCLVGAFNTLNKHHQTEETVPQQRIQMPTPAQSSSAEEDTDLDTALLTATREIVAERGYEGATLARICERSGVQRSSVYWRYKDKDTLIQIAVASSFLALTKNLPPTTAAEPTAWCNQLSTELTACLQKAADDISTVRSGLLMKLQHRQPATMASADIQTGLTARFKELEQWIDTGLEPQQLAHNLGAITAWVASILAEGLLLGLAFNTSYDTALLEKVFQEMLRESVPHKASHNESVTAAD